MIALACSQAPDGRQRWTLERLSDRMVCLGYVEHISPKTVRTTLKKTRLLTLAQKILVFPESEADGDFVYHVEDVLDVYCQPYDPAVPRICMDENRCESRQGEVSARASQARIGGPRRLHL